MCRIVPYPFTATLESSAHNTNLASILVSLLKKLLSPHMWLLAPVSRYWTELFKQPRLSSSPYSLSSTQLECNSTSDSLLLSLASKFCIIINIPTPLRRLPLWEDFSPFQFDKTSLYDQPCHSCSSLPICILLRSGHTCHT